jgi:hypothetical protein
MAETGFSSREQGISTQRLSQGSVSVLPIQSIETVAFIRPGASTGNFAQLASVRSHPHFLSKDNFNDSVMVEVDLSGSEEMANSNFLLNRGVDC